MTIWIFSQKEIMENKFSTKSNFPLASLDTTLPYKIVMHECETCFCRMKNNSITNLFLCVFTLCIGNEKCYRHSMLTLRKIQFRGISDSLHDQPILFAILLQFLIHSSAFLICKLILRQWSGWCENCVQITIYTFAFIFLGRNFQPNRGSLDWIA